MTASGRLAGILLMLVIMLITGGCWDRRELQDRNFVLAVAIDAAEAGLKPGQGAQDAKTESFVQPHGDKRYRISLQILRPTKSQSEQKDGGKTYVLSNTGQSLFEMVRDTLGQTSKSLYFEHIQAIVISEAALRESGLKTIIDWFQRDAEMRWRIKVFITPGEARPIIEYIPPSKEAGGMYLANILKNHPKNIHAAGARTDLGNISNMLDNKADLAIPQIVLKEKTMKLGGIALLKKDKFVGYADEHAVAGIKMLRGTEKSAIITVPGDRDGDLVAFEVFRHDTRLEPHVEGDNIYFTLDITMWGNIGEYQAVNRISSAADPAFTRRTEQRAAEEVKRTVLYGKNTCQSMGVDVLTFGTKLKTNYPEKWKEIKDNWDEIYPNIPLVVSVNVVIEQLGEHK